MPSSLLNTPQALAELAGVSSFMTGNEIAATSVSKDRMLYTIAFKDADQQFVVFGDNKIFGYQKFWADKTKATRNTSRYVGELAEWPHSPDAEEHDEEFIATITDANGKAVNELVSSDTVANMVWSNNTGSSVD